MDWDTHKKLLLKNFEFRKALAETELEYQIARAIIAARIKNRLTQKQLAEKLKTRQSVVSRLENATSSPSLSFLRRVAEALDVQLKVRFEPRS